MRTRSFRITFLGLAMAASTALAVPPAATAAPVAPAALPTCTTWSTHFAAYTTDYVVHVPTLGRNTFNKSCALRYGAKNDAVKVLQRALRHCSGYPLSIDGQYGSNTRGAVLNLQQRMNASYNAGLQEDGEYGPATSDWVKFPVWTYPGNVMTNGCDHSPF